MTASSASPAIAAAAAAGAVLRPSVSSMIANGVTPIWRSCSATMKRCSSLHTTSGGAKRAASVTRRTVSWNMVEWPASGRSCFG